MSLLIKSVLLLFSIFFTIFLIIKFSGVLSVEDLKNWFEILKSKPSYVIGALVVLLLFVDLFVAVPTMITILLAGYFLGFWFGAMYAFIGLASASFTGYFLSSIYGRRVLNMAVKDEQEKEKMQEMFVRHGVGMIVLSRAMPMLPEISSILAGTCKMPLIRFVPAWMLSSLPYLLIISYAGSISDLNNPQPAIFAALGVTAMLWLSWAIFMRNDRKREIRK